MKPNLLLLISLLLIFLPTPIHAIVDPLASPNNQYGIHIIDENDIASAVELVNSSGGDWGYVTLVIRQDDRHIDKWQGIFNRLRRHHLIPIVRIATQIENGVWLKPQSHQVAEWIGFLNQLNWVVKNRYIILFNEPNHAKEWGNDIKPEEYTRIVSLFHQHLKKASPDYFILPAGFDVAASNTPETMDSEQYFSIMHQTNPAIFTLFDGWTSHSYPNPGFIGSPYDSGKSSIRGYQWELNHLQSYGLKPTIPVFITETGWQHQQGKVLNPSFPTPQTLSSYYRTAFAQAWNQPQIVAITPFLLNYQDEPFDHFSWLEYQTNKPLDHYSTVAKLPKKNGKPEQINDSISTTEFWPQSLVANTRYALAITFQNTGQSIWKPDEVSLRVDSTLSPYIQVTTIPPTEPFETAKVWLEINTPNDIHQHSLVLQLYKDNQPFGQIGAYQLNIVPPNNLFVRTKLWFERMLHPDNFIISLQPIHQAITQLLNFQSSI